jgi:hypothetical protein
VEDLAWERGELIERLSEDFWRYFSPASSPVEAAAEAAQLLDMPVPAILELGNIQFLNSPEVRRLLDELPGLMRALATSSIRVEEKDPERISGAPRWGKTIAQRATSGLAQAVVTASASRAYDTPENQLLKFCLGAIVGAGRGTRWYQESSSGPAADEIRARMDRAEHFLQNRRLQSVRSRRLSQRAVRRVASGRRAQRYRAAIEVNDLYEALLGRLDTEALRESVTARALALTRRSRLFEVLCAFRILDQIDANGWELEPFHVGHAGDLSLSGDKGEHHLEVFVEGTPSELRQSSRYREVLTSHNIKNIQPLRPDIVLRIEGPGGRRWILVEVKGGDVGVPRLARRATLDLLGYWRDFQSELEEPSVASAIGLGVVWGSGLAPGAHNEIRLCTLDKLNDALVPLIGDAT